MVIAMTDTEAMEYMDSLNKYGSVLGIETMKALCEKLGNPQNAVPMIHIAGTNGKGSVLAYISTVLKEAGYKTGRYISPVIYEKREGIQINSKWMTKRAYREGVEVLKGAADALVGDGKSHPTIFEMETALAFWYFAKQGCDMVVLETGMGGDQDATNVCANKAAAVFTSVSMDHMQFLGNTLQEIAAHKAGIIVKGVPVISAVQQPEVLRVLEEEAGKLGSAFTQVCREQIRKVKYGISRQQFTYAGWKDLEISLAGKHQIENAVLAVEVLQQLSQKGIKISENAIRKGLADTCWPGRFSVVSEKPFFIADGAHNTDAAVKFAESVRFYFSGKKVLFIMGVLRDKEYDKILCETADLAEHIITITPPGNPRALSAYELAQAAKQYHQRITAADSLEEAVELSYLLADKNTVIIAFGSLSYMGKVMELVQNRDQIRRDSHGKSR